MDNLEYVFSMSTGTGNWGHMCESVSVYILGHKHDV